MRRIFLIAFFFECWSLSIVNAQSDITNKEIVYQQSENYLPRIITKTYKKTLDQDSLILRVYHPRLNNKKKFPAIIFVFGYPDSITYRDYQKNLQDFGQYTSWAELFASEGFVSITYQTQSPSKDLKDLFDFINSNAEKFQIDVNSIGIWSCSANVPIAIWGLSEKLDLKIKAAALYYGIMPFGDDAIKEEIVEFSKNVGFEYLPIDSTFKPSASFFIVRAGKDHELINRSIDNFVKKAVVSNYSMTFINNSEGIHAFDILQDTTMSKQIIRQTITFMKFHLFEPQNE